MRRDVSGVGPEVEPVLVVVAAVEVGVGPEEEVAIEVGIHVRKGQTSVAWRKQQARPGQR